MIKVCVGLPVWGSAVSTPGLAAMTRAAVDAGVDGIWVADHVVLDASARSRYPGNPTGKFFLAADQDWYDAFTSLGYISAFSGDLELGTGIALANLRQPAILAKQVASIARLSGAPFGLGVGIGWAEVEYEAAGVPWEGRGRRLEDTIRVMREYWKGMPQPGDYGVFTIPEGVRSYPTPPSKVPVLFGGHGEFAIARAARLGDGWIASMHAWDGAKESLSRDAETFLLRWKDEGRGEAPEFGTVQPLPRRTSSAPDFPSDAQRHIAEMQEIGVTRIVFNISWDDLDATRRVMDVLVAANAAVG